MTDPFCNEGSAFDGVGLGDPFRPSVIPSAPQDVFGSTDYFADQEKCRGNGAIHHTYGGRVKKTQKVPKEELLGFNALKVIEIVNRNNNIVKQYIHAWRRPKFANPPNGHVINQLRFFFEAQHDPLRLPDLTSLSFESNRALQALMEEPSMPFIKPWVLGRGFTDVDAAEVGRKYKNYKSALATKAFEHSQERQWTHGQDQAMAAHRNQLNTQAQADYQAAQAWVQGQTNDIANANSTFQTRPFHASQVTPFGSVSQLGSHPEIQSTAGLLGTGFTFPPPHYNPLQETEAPRRFKAGADLRSKPPFNRMTTEEPLTKEEEAAPEMQSVSPGAESGHSASGDSLSEDELAGDGTPHKNGGVDSVPAKEQTSRELAPGDIFESVEGY